MIKSFTFDQMMINKPANGNLKKMLDIDEDSLCLNEEKFFF